MKAFQQSSNQLIKNQVSTFNYAFFFLVCCLILTVLPDLALAGQTSLSTELDTNLEGTIKKVGKIVALTSFGLGTIASAIKFNPYVFASAIGVSLASLYGAPVITNLFSAII